MACCAVRRILAVNINYQFRDGGFVEEKIACLVLIKVVFGVIYLIHDYIGSQINWTIDLKTWRRSA